MPRLLNVGSRLRQLGPNRSVNGVGAGGTVSSLNTGLLAVYPLTEAAGSFANAYTGAGALVSATRVGTVGQRTGLDGSTLVADFAGTGNATWPSDTAMAAGSAFTMLGWVYRNAGAADNRALIWRGAAPVTSDYLIFQNGGLTDMQFFRSGGGGSTTLMGNLGSGVWTFFGFRISGLSLRCYLGGSTFDATLPSGSGEATAQPTAIGSFPDNTSRLNGAMTKLSFWSRALTDAEVTTYRNGDLGPTIAAGANPIR